MKPQDTTTNTWQQAVTGICMGSSVRVHATTSGCGQVFHMDIAKLYTLVDGGPGS